MATDYIKVLPERHHAFSSATLEQFVDLMEIKENINDSLTLLSFYV